MMLIVAIGDEPKEGFIMTRLTTISLAAALSLGFALPAFAGSFGNEVMLNPQPLPPKEILTSRYVTTSDAVALNPQPLPPKDGMLSRSVTDYGAVMLNPQPLPPKAKFLGKHVQ
jgi:hypothetical protein